MLNHELAGDFKFAYYGRNYPKVVIIRGLGCPAPTDEDSRVINNVLSPGNDSYAAARFNTAALSAKDAQKITIDNFLEQGFVRSFIAQLSEVDVDAAGAILSVESYSGAVFDAAMAAAGVHPDNLMSKNLFRALSAKRFSRIINMNAASTAGRSGGDVDRLVNFAMERRPHLLADYIEKRVAKYIEEQCRVLAPRQGETLEESKTEYLSRARQLWACSQVVSQCLGRDLKFPDTLGTFDLVMNKRDTTAKPIKNVQFYKKIQEKLPKGKARIIFLESKGFDAHDSYHPKNALIHRELREKIGL